MMKRVILVSVMLIYAPLAAQASSFDTPGYGDQTAAQAEPSRTIEIEFLHKKRVSFSNIRIERGLVVAEIDFKGRRGLCVIDTGSDVTIVDKTFAGSDNSLPTETVKTSLKGWNGILTGSHLDDADVFFANQIHIKGTLISADLAKARELTGIDFFMILGMDVLRETAFILDLEKNRIFFAPSGSIKFDRSRWASAPIMAGIIDGNLNGQDVKLKIDTGSSTPLIVSDENRTRIFGNLQPVPLAKTFVDIAGNVSKSFGISGADWKFLIFHMKNDVRITTESSENFDGYLGLEFFKDKVTIFDFPKEEIFLRSSGESIAEP